jgi:hypothetical protein
MATCKSEGLSNPYYRAHLLGLPVKLDARLRSPTRFPAALYLVDDMGIRV